MDTARHPPVDEQIIKDMLWAFAVRSPEHAALLLSEEGDVTWTNAGAEIILGAAPGGLVGMNLSRFFVKRDVNAGIPEHELVEARHRGTASKMQMESSRERCRAATAASDAKSAAIAMLAHELRNPLSGISLAVGLLQRRADGDEQFGGPVQVIERNVALSARLIDDLMHHSKVHSDGFCLERSRCSLRELLEASSDIARRQMEQDERTLRVLVPRADIEVRVDRMRMQQVFVNLIANALRYTPVPGRIWVSGTLEGTEVIVRVSDEGVGIASERLERLFEMFTLQRMEPSKLGLGLGLALVKRIVELHGGSVQARSEGPGKGSQFVVRFPAHD